MKRRYTTLEKAWTIIVILLICLVAAGYQFYKYKQNLIDPANPPDIINCLGRKYQRSNSTTELSIKTEFLCLIDERGLYSEYPRGKYQGKYDVTGIYLKVGNNRFITYYLLGGP